MELFRFGVVAAVAAGLWSLHPSSELLSCVRKWPQGIHQDHEQPERPDVNFN
jgi:hypothetical protein